MGTGRSGNIFVLVEIGEHKMRKRTFVYQAYVAPKKPKAVKFVRPENRPKAAPKPKPEPVDTSAYTAIINAAMQKFPLYYNSQSVILLDKLAKQFSKLSELIAKGNERTVKRNIDVLLELLKQKHNGNVVKLAPTGSDTHAKSVFNIAQRVAKGSVDQWLESGGDAVTKNPPKLIDFDTTAVCLSDAANYLHIANYIRLGQRLLANYVAQDMDTGPRDEIPTRTFNWFADHRDSRLYR
jgi:hypothetical protein